MSRQACAYWSEQLCSVLVPARLGDAWRDESGYVWADLPGDAERLTIPAPHPAPLDFVEFVKAIIGSRYQWVRQEDALDMAVKGAYYFQEATGAQYQAAGEPVQVGHSLARMRRLVQDLGALDDEVELTMPRPWPPRHLNGWPHTVEALREYVRAAMVIAVQEVNREPLGWESARDKVARRVGDIVAAQLGITRGAAPSSAATEAGSAADDALIERAARAASIAWENADDGPDEWPSVVRAVLAAGQPPPVSPAATGGDVTLDDLAYEHGQHCAAARMLCAWLVSMDDPEDVLSREQRRTVTLTEVIERARHILAAQPGPQTTATAPTQAEVSSWLCERFGPERDLLAQLEKLREEVEELREAVDEVSGPFDRDRERLEWEANLRDETADVVIVCMAIAVTQRFNLQSAIASKWSRRKRGAYAGADTGQLDPERER